MENQQSTVGNMESKSETSSVDIQLEPTNLHNFESAQSSPAAPASEQISTVEHSGVQQPPSAEETEPQQVPPRQVVQPGSVYQLPPGYGVDPATGQVVFVGSVMQQPAVSGVVYMQPHAVQPAPEQIAAQQAVAQQRYGQVINSVEQFFEGEATVSDVVKTLYINTTQDDQLWKGVIVGAAAAVLLTSKPVREVMGKTLGGVFPGLNENQPVSSEKTTKTSAKPETEKE